MTLVRVRAIIANAFKGALPFVTILGVLLLAATSGGAEPYKVSPSFPTTIYTYDLTPTTSYDWSSKLARDNAWAEVHLVAALQGLVNRQDKQLYTTYVTTDAREPGNVDKFWLMLMRSDNGWLQDNQVVQINSIEGLVKQFSAYYNGVVLYDLNVPATSNVASTVAGCENLLPIPYDPTPGSVYSRLVTDGPHLPVRVRLVADDGSPLFTGAETGSAKCDAYLWAKRRYIDTNLCNVRLFVYSVDSWVLKSEKVPTTPDYERFGLINHDYYIAHKAFFFDLSPWDDERPQDEPDQVTGSDYRTMVSIFESATAAYNNYLLDHTGSGGAFGAAGGTAAQAHKDAVLEPIAPDLMTIGGTVPTKWKYCKEATASEHDEASTQARFLAIANQYNARLDADTYPHNAMANASFFAFYPVHKSYARNVISPKDWVAPGYADREGNLRPWTFVAIEAATYDSTAALYQFLPSAWMDGERGGTALAWAFNPNLAKRFPLGFDWTRRTASFKDYFYSCSSGCGKLNPGYLDGDRPFSDLPSGVDLWKQSNIRYNAPYHLTITDVVDGNAPQMSKDALAACLEFSPDGIIAQKTAQPYELIPGTTTPLIRSEDTLPTTNDGDDAAAVVKQVVALDTGSGPHFHIFHAGLLTPSQQLKLISKVETSPKVVVVDTCTFMALLRTYLLPTAVQLPK